MFIVKTSIRAFLLALLPLVLVQGVLFAMALVSSQTSPPMIELPTPDVALGLFVARIALDAAGFVLGHFAARALGYGSRTVYACIGGVAAAIGYTVALQYGLALGTPPDGTIITAGILPILAGMAAGFLYGQFAGREVVTSGAARLVLARSIAESAATAPEGVEPSLRPTSPATFAGPIQVRSSFAATMLAALVPALLAAIFFFMMTYTGVSGIDRGPDEPLRFIWSRQVMALALPAQIFLTTAMVTVLPSAIFVALAHGLARAMGRTGGLAYAGAGALIGLACGTMLIPLADWESFPFTNATILIPPLAICGAIMMTVYRRFAGLEPRPLPEPVLAREIEALVPEDHPSRNSRAVVLNG